MEDRALYLEADEDITSAIDKLKKAPAGPVQIVVPKRSTLLQSVINLKLLKKAADDSKRELVLVTGDKVATDLAARLGLAVAPSVGAKASVAKAAESATAPAAEEVIEDDSPPPPPPAEGEAVAAPVPKEPKLPRRQVQPMLRQRQLPDPPSEEPTAEAEVGNDAGTKAKSKVPNYNKFQKRLIWGGLVILLIVMYYIGTYFFSSAKVTLYVSASPTPVSSNFGVDPSASSSNVTAATLTGQTISLTKTLTTTFQASGSQDEGTKASGTMTISNCLDTNSHTFAAGTQFQAPDGNLFASTGTVTVPPGSGNFFGCTTPGTATIGVQAVQNGDTYNEAPAAYTISGLPSSEQTGKVSITAKGDQMAGGTTNIVTVVAQSDVATAQAAALSGDTATEQKNLKAKAPATTELLAGSFAQTAADVTSSPAVGQAATSATLTLQVTYTELAVPRSDLETYLKAQEQSQLGASNEIYDDGFSGAQIAADGKTSTGLAQFTITTTAYGGTKIDATSLAKQLRGMRYGDAVDQASGEPDVTQASISLWPGWLTSLPHIQSHIKVNIAVAKAR